MSTETEMRAAFESGTNTVSADTAETFRKQMEARGLDPSAALAKHGIGQQPSTDPSPPKATSYAPDIGPDGLPRLTSEQTAQAAATLRKFWTGDPAELEARLANASAAPVAQPAPENRSEEQIEFDNSSLAPPVDAASYDLNGLWLGRDMHDKFGHVSDQLAPLDRTIRSTLSELNVAKGLGRSTAEAFMDSASAWSKVAARGEVATKRYHLEQSATFAKIAGIGWSEAAAQLKPFLAKMSESTRTFLAGGALESAPARIKLWQAFTLSQARAKMGGR